MFRSALGRHLAAAIALALSTVSAAGCSPERGAAVIAEAAPAAVPVYPGAKREARSDAEFSTNDSFETVYGWYKKNMPQASERSVAAAPQDAAIFIVGFRGDRIRVTITGSRICCRTLIVIAAG
jgi:hypothetical protein